MKRIKFPDGARLSKIDLFHLYAYDGKIDNREKVLDNVFLKFSKKGDYYLVHPGLKRDHEYWDIRSTNVIFQDDTATLVQNIKS